MVHFFAKIRQNRKKIDFFNILDQITNWKTEDPAVSQIAYFNFAIFLKIKTKKECQIKGRMFKVRPNLGPLEKE